MDGGDRTVRTGRRERTCVAKKNKKDKKKRSSSQCHRQHSTFLCYQKHQYTIDVIVKMTKAQQQILYVYSRLQLQREKERRGERNESSE